MEVFDNERKKQEVQKKKREALVKDTEKEKETERSYADTVAFQPAGSEDRSYKNKSGVEELQYRSDWARQMSQVNLEEQLKRATEEAARMEGHEPENKL